MLKNNKTFLTIVNMASSIVWGGIGCFVVTIMVASWFQGNRTWDYWEILLLLGGIQLILSAILIWNRQRVVKMVVGLFASLCSFFALLSFSMAAAAGHWPPLEGYLAIFIPIVGFLLSILSLFCLPPKKSKKVITEEQLSR